MRPEENRWTEPSGAVQEKKKKVNKRLENERETEGARKKDDFSGRHFAGVSASAERGLTVSVMKGSPVSQANHI